jgi:hypothetical protein
MSALVKHWNVAGHARACVRARARGKMTGMGRRENIPLHAISVYCKINTQDLYEFRSAVIYWTARYVKVVKKVGPPSSIITTTTTMIHCYCPLLAATKDKSMFGIILL